MGKNLTAKRKNFVNINGHLYDAHTGLPIENSAQKTTSTVKSLDGIIPASGPAQANRPKPIATPKPTTKTNHTPPKKRHTKPAVTIHHQVKRSSTLNRKATPKPQIPTSQIKAKARPPKSESQRKIEALRAAKHEISAKVKKEREERAKTTPKHQHVAKFAINSTRQSISPESSRVADVQQQVVRPKEISGSELKRLLIQRQMEQVASPSKPTPDKPKRKSLFARKPRFVTTLALGLSSLIIAGYVTYVNIPSMALKIASREAGFVASLPAYKPNGYKFAGPIAYEKGEIVIKFVSNTDPNKYFTITERKTSWDSLTLRNEVIGERSDRCSTYQTRGLTIYLCDGKEATWVNGGVWYTVAGGANLTSEQILNLASSL